MKLQQLEYFYAINKYGSYKSAAAELNVSQPAVTAAIQKLEEELDVPLFDRKYKRATLTPAGEIALNITANIVNNINNLYSEMDIISSKQRHAIRLVFCQYDNLPKLVATDFVPNHPGVKINMDQRSAISSLSGLENGEYDIAIVLTDSLTSKLDSIPYGKQELGVFCSKNHPLAEHDILKPSQLQGAVVCTRPGGSREKCIKEYFRKNNTDISLKSMHSFEDQHITSIKMGYSNDIAILDIAAAKSNDAIHATPFDPPLYIDLSVAWLKNRFCNETMRDFIKFLGTADNKIDQL